MTQIQYENGWYVGFSELGCRQRHLKTPFEDSIDDFSSTNPTYYHKLLHSHNSNYLTVIFNYSKRIYIQILVVFQLVLV